MRNNKFNQKKVINIMTIRKIFIIYKIMILIIMIIKMIMKIIMKIIYMNLN
jgi:hypothetical protein